MLYLFCLGSRHEGEAEGNIFGFEFQAMEKVGYAVTSWVAFQVVVLWIEEWAGPWAGGGCPERMITIRFYQSMI